jgi:hypothetical protein
MGRGIAYGHCNSNAKSSNHDGMCSPLFHDLADLFFPDLWVQSLLRHSDSEQNVENKGQIFLNLKIPFTETI